MTDYVGDFQEYLVQKKAVSANTLESYMRDVHQYVSFLVQENEEACSPDDTVEHEAASIESFIEHLREVNKSSATITRMLASVRSYYQYLVQRGIVKDNPAKLIKLERAEKKMPEILTDKEILLLLSMPDERDLKGVRDKAMMELLYATGIRVSELIHLNTSDVRCKKGERGEVICRGTKAARTIPMHRTAVDALLNYLNNVRPALATADSEDALFINLNGARLSRQGFWKIIKNYAEEAKIKKEITPHTLRHSFALHLYQNGASLHDLQMMLGHADISSTQMYANMSRQNGYSDVYDRCHPLAARMK